MKRAWAVLAASILGSMIWLLVPDRGVRSSIVVITNNVRQKDIISVQLASKELDSIKKEIDTNWGRYSGAMAYDHMNRLFFISSHFPPTSRTSKYDAVWARVAFRIGYTKNYSANARRDQPNYNQVREDFIRLRDSDSGSWINFSPITETYNFKPLLEHWKINYFYTILFAPFFFICLLMHREILVVELKRFFIFRIIFFSLIWPTTIWFYPSKDLTYKVKEGLRWLNWAVSIAISVVLPGAVKAGSKKVVFESNDSSSHGLFSSELSISKLDPKKSEKKKKTTFNIELFGDTRHDRQAIFRVTHGRLVLLNQNRMTADRKSTFSHIGLGTKLKSNRYLSTTATFGPQLTYEKHRIDRVVLFATAAISDNQNNNSITAINRLSFGIVPEASFSDRHLQILRSERLPSWVVFQAEELRASRKWRELFFGANINIGRLVKKKNFLKDIYAYPMWDAAKGNFDLRIGYSHSFVN